jgi:hypothetical protein
MIGFASLPAGPSRGVFAIRGKIIITFHSLSEVDRQEWTDRRPRREWRGQTTLPTISKFGTAGRRVLLWNVGNFHEDRRLIRGTDTIYPSLEHLLS